MHNCTSFHVGWNVQTGEVWFTQHAKNKKTDQTERNRYVEFKLPPSWRKTDILQGDDQLDFVF